MRDFDLVTLDRVRRIDIEPNLAVWQEYARAHRLHPAVQAYLELRPQHFYRIQNDVDGPQFVTARGWEDLSAMLTACTKLDLPVDEALIGQYLRHPEVARDFAAYWELYKKYRQDYGVEDILQGRPFAAVLERAQKPLLMSASALSACCWPAEHPLCRCPPGGRGDGRLLPGNAQL